MFWMEPFRRFLARGLGLELLSSFARCLGLTAQLGHGLLCFLRITVSIYIYDSLFQSSSTLFMICTFSIQKRDSFQLRYWIILACCSIFLPAKYSYFFRESVRINNFYRSCRAYEFYNWFLRPLTSSCKIFRSFIYISLSFYSLSVTSPKALHLSHSLLSFALPYFLESLLSSFFKCSFSCLYSSHSCLTVLSCCQRSILFCTSRSLVNL